MGPLTASTLPIVQANMKRHNAWDSRLHVVKGFFSDSIPKVADQIPSIAFLRLDGDLYASTMDVLRPLYDKVVKGGTIYFDDWGSFTGCRRAVEEFRGERGITAPIQYIREYPGDGVEAVWWQKD